MPGRLHPNWADFRPDLRLLITACADGTARLWSVSTGEPVGNPMYHPHVNRVKFSTDGKHALTADPDGKVYIWETSNSKRAGSLQHEGIYEAEFSKNGSFLVTGEGDGRDRLWRVPTGEEVDLPLGQFTALSEEFGPDDQTLAIGDSRGVRLWKTSDSRPQCSIDRVSSLRHHGLCGFSAPRPRPRAITYLFRQRTRL